MSLNPRMGELSVKHYVWYSLSPGQTSEETLTKIVLMQDLETQTRQESLQPCQRLHEALDDNMLIGENNSSPVQF